jgi:hypothetical protein
MNYRFKKFYSTDNSIFLNFFDFELRTDKSRKFLFYGSAPYSTFVGTEVFTEGRPHIFGDNTRSSVIFPNSEGARDGTLEET